MMKRALSALMALLAGCAVGPDYREAPNVAPVAQQATSFHRADAELTSTAPPAADWWHALNDPQLEKLIHAALIDSPTVQEAQARLRKSRGVLRQLRAAELPTVSADVVALRSNAGLPGGEEGEEAGDLRFYNVGFDSMWEIDLFGGGRRAREGARADAQAITAELEDVHVSLAAEVGRTYITLRDRQQRLVLLERSAQAERDMLNLTEQRRKAGVASELDALRMRTELENIQASLLPLQLDIEASLDALAVLTGREPGALDADLRTVAALPQLPAQVAVGDPREMLRRRPDIRAAERRLAASTATIGVRTADLFPTVNLIGTLGYGSSAVSGLLDDDNLSYLVAPVLRWSFLDFGARRAKVTQAEADRDVALARYRNSVLRALQDTESGLSRFGLTRQSLITYERALDSATRAALLAEQRRKAGTLSEIDRLDIVRTRIAAEQNVARVQAELVQSYIALQKSLGLGWEG